MAWRIITVAAFLAAPAFASGQQSAGMDLAAKHARVRAETTKASKAGEPGRPSERFAELYRRRLTTALGQIPGQSDNDLHELFSILEEASFYAVFSDYDHRQEYLAGLRRIVGELRSRNALRDDELNAFYRRLVVRREFAEAASLVRDSDGRLRPEYAAFDLGIPEGQVGPFGYVLDDDAHVRLKRIALPEDGNYIVIVVGCHFADDAARALSREPRVAGMLSNGRVVWLFDESLLDVEALAQWKRAFPRFKASIAFDNAAWTGVTFGAMPSFHFFRGGELVQSEEGWNGANGVTGFMALLESTGIMSAPVDTNRAATSAKSRR